MNSSDDDNQGLIFGVLFGLIVLVLGVVFGVVQHHRGSHKAASMAPPMALSPAAQADVASIRVEGGVVTFYFATAKAEVATGADAALADVVRAVAEGKMAVISGYHDATGDAARNEELAKQRAIAVRDALVALGAAADKIELRKPEVMTGSGSNAEARRVEVRIQ